MAVRGRVLGGFVGGWVVGARLLCWCRLSCLLVEGGCIVCGGIGTEQVCLVQNGLVRWWRDGFSGGGLVGTEQQWGRVSWH